MGAKVAVIPELIARASLKKAAIVYDLPLDDYQASHRGAKEVLGEHRDGDQCKIRSSKYLNNLIEQDHRSIKLRLGPMLGFKKFRRAATTAGVELMHRIRKDQFELRKLRTKGAGSGYAAR